jgi:hypothetical protein
VERKIEATNSVEVYPTDKNQICIKQEVYGFDDQFVIFHPRHADEIARWILEVKEELEESEAD